MNNSINKWIVASINKHFYDSLNSTLPVYVTGLEIQPNSEYIEVRIDGPRMTELSRNYFRFYIEVNVLVTCNTVTNLYRIHEITGLVVSTFTPIVIKKYGEIIEDPICCADVYQDFSRHERIQTYNLGKIEKQLNLEQSVVEAHYIMNIEGDRI